MLDLYPQLSGRNLPNGMHESAATSRDGQSQHPTIIVVPAGTQAQFVASAFKSSVWKNSFMFEIANTTTYAETINAQDRFPIWQIVALSSKSKPFGSTLKPLKQLAKSRTKRGCENKRAHGDCLEAQCICSSRQSAKDDTSIQS